MALENRRLFLHIFMTKFMIFQYRVKKIQRKKSWKLSDCLMMTEQAKFHSKISNELQRSSVKTWQMRNYRCVWPYDLTFYNRVVCVCVFSHTCIETIPMCSWWTQSVLLSADSVLSRFCPTAFDHTNIFIMRNKQLMVSGKCFFCLNVYGFVLSRNPCDLSGRKW